MALSCTCCQSSAADDYVVKIDDGEIPPGLDTAPIRNPGNAEATVAEWNEEPAPAEEEDRANRELVVEEPPDEPPPPPTTELEDEHCTLAVLLTFEEASAGLDLVLRENRLLVKALRPGSAIDEWNQQNSNRRVFEGDQIVSVNGVKATEEDVHAAVAELRKMGEIRLVVRHPQNINFTFDKDGRKLGLKLKSSKGVNFLVIEDIKAGVVSEWNNEHGDMRICPGDHIMKVNGRDDPAEMMDLVTQENHVEMVIGHHHL